MESSTLEINPILKRNDRGSHKHSSLEDNVENTIFVGNLPNTTKRKDLKKFFSIFGPVLHTRLRCAIRKELKIPKKLAVIKQDFHEDSNHINAFVKFKTLENCKAALQMNGKLFKDHHLRVTLAENTGKSDPKKSIFVGNISFKAKDDDIWKAFEDCGKIESVRVIRDIKTGIGKGFGYVNFKSADSVELALRLNGMVVLEREIRVNRVVSGTKNNSRNVKKKKKESIPDSKINVGEAKHKLRSTESKPIQKIKIKYEFQGQKTKPIHKKFKKKKKFDKKKMTIKQIAKGISKKK